MECTIFMNKSLATDLNLLRTFVIIYETKSLTRAAERLHISQPAVSHALSRLRALADDRLFIRAEGAMRPTAAADELFALVAGPMQQIDDIALGGLGFDPARSTRMFSLALTDFGGWTILPQLVSAASRVAPAVRFAVHPVETETLADDLARGRIDAAVASTRVPGPVESEVALQGGYGCLVPQDFPEHDGRISEQHFRTSPHAGVSGGIGHTHVQHALEQHGALPEPHVVVRSFSMLPPLVADCGLIAVVPSHGFLPIISGLPLKLLDLPFDIPPADVQLHWHSSARSSPARSWLLDVMRTTLQSLRADDQTSAVSSRRTRSANAPVTGVETPRADARAQIAPLIASISLDRPARRSCSIEAL